MTTEESGTAAEAVDALKSLGCREYEAKCFVALSRLRVGTAKAISEVTDIPRTRVYDAMDDLVNKGLVEVHYSTPKQYRATQIPDAISWFRERYENELDRLEESSESLTPIESTSIENDSAVWSLTGLEATLIRANNVMQSAEQYVVVWVDDDSRFNREVMNLLDGIQPPEPHVVVPDDALRSFVSESLDETTPTIHEADVPVVGIRRSETPEQAVTIVIGDGDSALIRTRSPASDQPGTNDDQAIVAEGRHNSVVTWFRCLFGL